MTELKTKKIEVDGKTVIKCGNVEITDEGKPFSTKITVDGKPIGDIFGIQSFKYEVTVQKNKKSGLEPGKHRLTIEYYPIFKGKVKK